VPVEYSASDIRGILTRDELADLADGRSFARGEKYHAEGRVEDLRAAENEISARVQGNEDYRVRLWAEHGEVMFSCSCPWAAQGNFCKHCVAVGLTWLSGSAVGSGSKKRRKHAEAEPVIVDDVRAMLEGCEKEELVSLLMTESMRADGLYETLQLKAALRKKPGRGASACRQTLTRAIRHRGFVAWDEAHDYARRIQMVIDQVEDMLTQGLASDVIELTEHAFKLLENAQGQVDDSDGGMRPIWERLAALHLAACRKVGPERKALARRLFEFEFKSDWDAFHAAAATYQEILGKEGLAEYQRLAEKEWKRFPALGPGDEREEIGTGRFQITSIMETLAELTGGLEELVSVKSRDLTFAYNFLQIAQLYQTAGQPDKALEWAERGLKAFPERTDGRLRVFLANEYHRRKRPDEAMALIWSEFVERQELTEYQLLKEHADRVREWPAWRAKALAHLRKTLKPIRPEPGFKRLHRDWYDGCSRLVEILLWEDKAEEAWQEAKSGDCGDTLWLELAHRREPEHPEDSIEVYKRLVESALTPTQPALYPEAVKLLKRIAQLQARIGQKEEFEGFLATVRMEHKAKRNLLKLLDATKWP